MTAGLDKRHCIVLKDGKFDTDCGADAQDVKDIFNIIGQQQAPVVLHFHGGLINKAAGIAGANVLTPIYEGAGTYPVFFVWESGWEDVVNQNLPSIFKEPIFQKLLMKLTQFAKGKVDKSTSTGVAKAIGTIPLPPESTISAVLKLPPEGPEPFANIDPRQVPADEELTVEEQEQFKEHLADDPTFEQLVQEIATPTPTAAGPVARGATVRASAATLMSPDVVEELTVKKAGARSISTALMIARSALVLAKIIQRFAQRRDHGFYLTIIEEIFRAFYVSNAGRFLWDGMKQDIVDSFGVGENCGGTLFLTEFARLCQEGKSPPITIVGHSAGAIYACRFLQEVQSRGLPPQAHFNLILIAPACDFNLLAKTIQSAGNRIDGIRIFGMGDERERQDALIKVIYPSSLLYFVSGVIEQQDDCPLAGMARYFQPPYDDPQSFPDIAYVRNFALLQKPHAYVWAESSAGTGFNCDMRTHGGWPSAAATVASVVYILKSGYGYAAAGIGQ